EAADDLVELTGRAPVERSPFGRPDQVAALHLRLLEVVNDDQVRALDGSLVELAAGCAVGAGSVDVHSWLEERAVENGIAGVRDRYDNLGAVEAVCEAPDRLDLD